MAKQPKVCILFAPSATEADTKRIADLATGAFDFHHFQNVDAAAKFACDRKADVACVVAKAGTDPANDGVTLFTRLTEALQRSDVYYIMYSRTVSTSPRMRQDVMTHAKFTCHMASHIEEDVVKALRLVSAECRQEGSLACPFCGKRALTSVQMWYHLPLYHIAAKNVRMKCPQCHDAQDALLPHFHDAHAPPGTHTDERPAVRLASFALCVVRRPSDGKFLVVQEYSNQGYWLPGGGIDASERPDIAAQRECLEEAGIKITLTGVLRVEVTPGSRLTRTRFIFYGHPTDEQQPCKTLPDFESMGACWVSVDEIQSGSLRLRGSEPLEWFTYIADGGAVHPLSVLAAEADPVPRVR